MAGTANETTSTTIRISTSLRRKLNAILTELASQWYQNHKREFKNFTMTDAINHLINENARLKAENKKLKEALEKYQG